MVAKLVVVVVGAVVGGHRRRPSAVIVVLVLRIPSLTRREEGSNSTFQKFPATRRGFEFNFHKERMNR
jgi:hypothetical protein